jgi:predicted nucleic acid-binding protein
MEWVRALRGAVVALDTAPLIYFIEAHPSYHRVIRPFFEAADRDEFRVVTSVLTITEVLVHPIRKGNASLGDQYRRILLDAENISPLPVSEIIAEEAAQLRALHGLRTPDALQMATAVHAKAAWFVTNDSRLPALPSLKLLVLNQVLAANPPT